MNAFAALLLLATSFTVFSYVAPDKQPAPMNKAPEDKPKRLIPSAPPAGGDDSLTSRRAFQAVSLGNKNESLEITPAEITIPSTKRFQIVTVRADTAIEWMVFNKAKEPVEWLPLPGTKSIQVFPNYDTDDEINVYANTAKDSVPSRHVQCTIIVTRKTKVPDDAPGIPEKPPAAGSALHFTIITDRDLPKTNRILAGIVASPDLRAGVENRGHSFWVLDQKEDVAEIKEKKLDAIVSKVGKVPLYIVQDASGVEIASGPLPNTMLSILDVLDRAAPPKPRTGG